MDHGSFKDIKTSRGFKYHYFHSAPRGDKPVLLLLHGFPGVSYDWRHVVSFFSKLGYGFIVPDLLGYAGTDKPTEPHHYRLKLMAADVVEILDAEEPERVISIGHDWGSGLNSRLANYYSERFVAFGFLALGYFPPMPEFNLDAINETSLEKHGYENFGYWYFFNEDGAAKIIEEHQDSLIHLSYAEKQELWRTNFCPRGAMEEWITSNRTTKLASWMSDEDIELAKEVRKGGYTAPLCWYKAFVRLDNAKDDAEIPKERYIINKPVFFGGCARDSTCIVEDNKAIINAMCPNATIVDFDTGHWVLKQAKEEVNQKLLNWIENL